MEFIKRMIAFGFGGVVGGGIGVAVASLLAPQSGEQLQESVSQLRAEAEAAGEVAKVQTQEAMKQRFRDKVNDQTALTGAAGTS